MKKIKNLDLLRGKVWHHFRSNQYQKMLNKPIYIYCSKAFTDFTNSETYKWIQKEACVDGLLTKEEFNQKKKT